MTKLRIDSIKKSGLKPTITKYNKPYYLQSAYSSEKEVNKEKDKLIDDNWKTGIKVHIFSGTGKYHGTTIYAIYGRVGNTLIRCTHCNRKFPKNKLKSLGTHNEVLLCKECYNYNKTMNEWMDLDD